MAMTIEFQKLFRREFRPSEATAEEKGIASKIVAVSRLFNFIFKTCPPYEIASSLLRIQYLGIK